MEIALDLCIVVAAVALFISERFPSALVAMMVLAVIMLVALVQPWLPWIRPGRWITLDEGVAGFSNPATIVVAAMFVLSAGLQSTGAIAWLAPWLARSARYPLLLVSGLLLAVCLVSAFINNTAAVAIFLPIVLTACARTGLAPSRLLIPLSYASQFGGVCTLIGTSTNLLVSSISERSGHGAFRLFEFAPMGLILAGAGFFYLLLFGRWLLPVRPSLSLVQSYQVADYVAELRITAASGLIGRPVDASGIGRLPGVRLLSALRHGQAVGSAPDLPLQAGDVLLVQAPVPELIALCNAWKLESEHEFHFADDSLGDQELRLAETVVAPVALAVAASLGIESRPLLMAVCFAASTSFCTPVGYQTNAMMQHPGRYRFADYLKIGLPLNVLFWRLSEGN